MNYLRLVAAFACLAYGTGCASFHIARKPTHATSKAARNNNPQPFHSYWNEIEVKGTPSIFISLPAQHAYFYKGKTLVGVSTISSGRKGFDTPGGNYKVIQKDAKHVSNLYGDYVDANGEVVQSNVDVTRSSPPEGAVFRGAKMPYFMRFTGGYGLHAGHLPGYRASHGCIRMPGEMARHFFENTQIGTIVTVQD